MKLMWKGDHLPGAALIRFSKQGDSWAIGFVNYLTVDSANAAIQAYNGMELPNGSRLKVCIKTGKMG